LSACSNEPTNKSTTNAVVKVVDKHMDEKSKKKFSIVVESLEEKTPQKVNLEVDSENTWNLISINQQYTVIYTLKSKTDGELIQIKNIDG